MSNFTFFRHLILIAHINNLKFGSFLFSPSAHRPRRWGHELAKAPVLFARGHFDHFGTPIDFFSFENLIQKFYCYTSFE